MLETKAKILLVDDDLETCEVLRELFADRYELEVAHDGEEAIVKINTLKPDCVILDNRMPKVSGREVLERLWSSGTRTKVIVTTGSMDPFCEDKYTNLGAYAVFIKPVDLNELESTVEDLLNL